ncbi:MFS transporter [Castellaniella sp. GW247-6E4]|uniref:MFS transporter n=1 Tax=Castellaniella sp. GW247-6E4 TaxID=3140380 RepID=UPI003314DB8B
MGVRARAWRLLALGPPPLRSRPPIWLLVMITISGTMAMHMFVPALPFAARGLATGVGEMQMTISLYILGLASGQLLYGPLSDALGRRPVLIAGLILYALAGLAAALAPNLHLLLGARLAQGLGGCAGLALGRAIVRDTAQADTAVRQLALMNLMIMIGPGLAPIVGGAIATSMSWRAIFWLLSALGLLTVWLTWRLLPETGGARSRQQAAGAAWGPSFPAGPPQGKSGPLGGQQAAGAAWGLHFFWVLLSSYRDLLSSVKFAGFAVGGGCTTTAIYAFIAAAPFIFIDELHRTAGEVGLFLGFMIVGMSVGNALTGRLIRRVPMERLMLTGNMICLVSAGALLTVVLAEGLTLYGILGIMLVFTCGAGMASPAALTKAISVDPARIGSAAGLYGCAQMTIGALCTTLAAVGGDPALSAAVVLVGAALLGQIAFWVALVRERAEAAAQAAKPRGLL